MRWGASWRTPYSLDFVRRCQDSSNLQTGARRRPTLHTDLRAVPRRRGRYGVEWLIAGHGFNMRSPELLAKLADCPKARLLSVHERCKPRYEGSKTSDKVKRAFCEFSSPLGFFDELEAETARDSGAVADAGRSFKANLEAAGDVANVPFLLGKARGGFSDVQQHAHGGAHPLTQVKDRR